MPITAEILTVGDELCRGEITNTNSQHLAERLTELGIHVRWMTSTTDDADLLDQAFSRAAGRADVIVCSGGLGPTADDRTVDVVSARLGVEPVIDPDAKAKMERRFASVGFSVTPNNVRQVRVPAGAEVLANRAGIAPGFRVRLPADAPGRSADAFFVPGVPRELYAILDDEILPRLRAAAGLLGATATGVLRVFGIGESHVDHRLSGLIDGTAGVSLHFRIFFPETLVKLVVRDENEARARATLERLLEEARRRLGPACYGGGDDSLPSVVGAALRAEGATVALAESCTGGLATHLLTTVPGSSDYVLGGVVAYANAAKTTLVDVPAALIAEHGAVSEPVARALARGARVRFGASYGIGITGIAGPGGGTNHNNKPTGLVHLAVAGPNGERHRSRVWADTRDRVQRVSAMAALELLRRILLGLADDDQGGTR